MILYAEAALINDQENWYTKDFTGNSIHEICNWFLKVLIPTGGMPAINDGNREGLEPGLLWICAKRTGDQELIFTAERYYAAAGGGVDYFSFETITWAGDSVPPDEPSWRHIPLPGTGIAVTRSNWETNGQYTLLQFTDTLVHQHYSFGNLTIYDQGAWLRDNGYHMDNKGISGEEHRRSMGTKEHSTMTLDNLSQTYTGGTLESFYPLDQSAMMSISSEPYQNFSHTRTVLWSGTWHQWLVVDDADHLLGEPDHSLQVRWLVASDVPGEPVENGWSFRRGSDLMTINIQAGQPATYQPIQREYAAFKEGNAYGVQMETKPLAWPIRLTSILSSHLEGTPQTTEVERQDELEGTIISSHREDKVLTWLLPKPGKLSARVDRYTLDGRAGCTWSRAGDLEGYCLFGGNNLTHNNNELINASNKESTLSVEVDFTSGKISIETPNQVSVKLFWPHPLETISEEQGESVTYTLEDEAIMLTLVPGRYHFIAHPTPRSRPTETPTPQPIARPEVIWDPEAIIDFANPLLADIADRSPDFQDDFSSQDKQWKSNTLEYELKDGKLQFSPWKRLDMFRHGELRTPEHVFVLELTPVFEKFSENGMDGFEIAFSILDTGYYVVDFGISGWATKKFCPQGCEDDQLAGRFWFSNPFKEGQPFIILLVVVNNQYAFFVDGEPIVMIADPSWKGGSVIQIGGGSNFTSKEGRPTFAFDQVKLWKFSELPKPP